MNDISNELDTLFEKVKVNKKILQFSENISLEELTKVCDASAYMSSILEFGKNAYSLLYCNKHIRDGLGLNPNEYTKQGFEYILKITHPDNLDSVYMLIKFFNEVNNHAETFTHTLYLNGKNGWEWIYSMKKPATYNQDGTIKYLLSVSCSLDDLLNTNEHDLQFNQNLNQYKANIDKYNSMTEREKQILKLIAEEYTSKEIGDMLFISPLTVDTHRKHLIEKLEVKSSIGLIRYALLFNLI
ncbi:MAG TPA: helix-turn-helix transcriptional regulator [Chitinophagales bacterium]|nr:helix-turn-helix transcriptional regulator [Chitinophagales bacterium]